MKQIFLLALTLAACTKKVSFETTEDARRQARENAQLVAVDWRRQNTLYADWELYVRGDSTIDAACPQGDGWASVDLKSKDGSKTVKLKCSTVSLSISCLEDSDFKTKAYANQDGRCNADIPHPLPKIAK